MAYVLNEELSMLKDSAKEFLKNQAPVSQLRSLRDTNNEQGFDTDTWDKMVEMGWTALTIPEEYDGMGFGYTGLGQILEETGRTLTSSPLLSSTLFGTTAILEAGSKEQKGLLLPKISNGEIQVTLAVDEEARHQPDRISTFLQTQNGGYSLNGEKTFVPDAHTADKIMVLCKTADGKIALVLVDSKSNGVLMEKEQLMDSRSYGSISFNDVPISKDQVLTNCTETSMNRVLDIGRIGISAELYGTSIEAFERCVAYLKERKQFGVELATFQGLQHRAAIMYCELEMCQSAVMNALTNIDEGEKDLRLQASIAKAKVSQTAQLVSNEAVQFYGGIGMTDDEEIGFFLKRARVAMAQLGDHNYHLDRFAQLNGY